MTAGRPPTSNAEFLAAVLGPMPAGIRPFVSCFSGNPKEARPQDWTGWAWFPELPPDAPGLNWYFTLAVYAPDQRGTYRRKGINCTAVHGVMLDDIGGKVDPQRLKPLPPSVVVETSPGNHQALYLFPEPVADRAAVTDLQAALIAADLCDPGAHGPTTRWCRLPFAVNGKHTPPTPCRLIEWHPDRRYTIAEIRAGLSLPDVAPTTLRVRQDVAPRAEWESRTEAQRAALLADLHSALAMLPADDSKAWLKYGHCLRASLPDAEAYELWAEWSAKSAKCDDAGLERFWTFEPDHAGYLGILSDARAAGWNNAARLFAGAEAPDPLPAPASPRTAPPVPSLAPAALRLVRGDAIAIEAVQWVWPGYLPAGMLAILGGAPGCGKTTIALALGAVITTGGRWPDDLAAGPHGDVLVWSGEDLPSVLVGRLAAMGADRSRVHFVDGIGEGAQKRAFDPGRDMPLLEAAALALPCVRLLIVDPIVSAVAGDSHKNAEVRRSLQPVVDLGQRIGCAVLGITHFTKGTAGRDPTERITGSLAFAALARVVLVAAKVKGDGDESRRVFLRAKSNIGPDDGGIAYELERVEVQPGIEGQRVKWLDAIEGTARDVLAEADGEQTDDTPRRSALTQFIRDQLRDGQVASAAFREASAGVGYSWSTVTITARKMGAVSEKAQGALIGGWTWKVGDPMRWARTSDRASHPQHP